MSFILSRIKNVVRVPWKASTKTQVAIILIVALSLSGIIISFVFFKKNSAPNSLYAAPGSAPALFYYNNSFYIYRGSYVTELPSGYKNVVELNNVGDSFSEKDFDGNVDGYVYINPSDLNVAYFRWKNWRDDSTEPYLIMMREE